MLSAATYTVDPSGATATAPPLSIVDGVPYVADQSCAPVAASSARVSTSGSGPGVAPVTNTFDPSSLTARADSLAVSACTLDRLTHRIVPVAAAYAIVAIFGMLDVTSLV